jgi:P27 family predicted phage terminase small subunit
MTHINGMVPMHISSPNPRTVLLRTSHQVGGFSEAKVGDLRKETTMGRRGPIPKTLKAKQLAGNPSKELLDHREPKPRAGEPTVPSTLGPVGRSLWRELVAEMTELKTLATADKRLLELACRAHEDHLQASALLASKGLTYESSTPTGVIVRPRPEVAMRTDSWKRFLKALAELGLTPMSRGRVQVPVRPEEHDPLREFLGGDN